MTYGLVAAPTAGRALAEQLPEAVATAALAFITGDLLRHPQRVGNPCGLRSPGGGPPGAVSTTFTYTIDHERLTVTVLDVAHRHRAGR